MAWRMLVCLRMWERVCLKWWEARARCAHHIRKPCPDALFVVFSIKEDKVGVCFAAGLERMQVHTAGPGLAQADPATNSLPVEEQCLGVYISMSRTYITHTHMHTHKIA